MSKEKQIEEMARIVGSACNSSEKSWVAVKVKASASRKNAEKFAERKKQMIEMRKIGKTYAEIGTAFGITRQRTFKILKG